MVSIARLQAYLRQGQKWYASQRPMNEQVECMSELVSSDMRPCLLTLILPDAVYPHQLNSLLAG